MAWNGSGTYSRPVTTVSPATGGTTIDVADQNTYTADVAAGVNACLAKNGENAATGNLPMGGFKHTGAADGVDAGDYATVGQALNATYFGNANGNPNISDSAFNITSSIADSVFESIGPTAGGADNDWAALDSVPSSANWVELKVTVTSSNAANDAIGWLYARATGGTDAVDIPNAVAFCIARNDGDTDLKQGGNLVSTKVPIDSSGYINLTWTETGNALITIYLVGYGTNG